MSHSSREPRKQANGTEEVRRIAIVPVEQVAEILHSRPGQGVLLLRGSSGASNRQAAQDHQPASSRVSSHPSKNREPQGVLLTRRIKRRANGALRACDHTPTSKSRSLISRNALARYAAIQDLDVFVVIGSESRNTLTSTGTKTMNDHLIPGHHESGGTPRTPASASSAQNPTNLAE